MLRNPPERKARKRYTTAFPNIQQNKEHNKMKLNLFIILLLFSTKIFAQNSKVCNIQKSEFIDAEKVDKSDLICIAKNSDKPYTIFYTLASWCAPCRMHFPDTIELEKTNKVNIYVVLVESEKDKRIMNAIDFIKSKSESVKYGVLKDEVYGTKTGKRNKKIATEMTPENNELIDDYGKLILVDKSGKIHYATNWKDYEGDSKNAKKMIESKILPLIN